MKSAHVSLHVPQAYNAKWGKHLDKSLDMDAYGQQAAAFKVSTHTDTLRLISCRDHYAFACF